MSVAVDFLYMPNYILLSSSGMVISRKLILFLYSSSIVNFVVGVILLNVVSILCIFVALFL